MGFLADLKAISNVQKIKMGGSEKLSVSQITGLIVNMMDARTNLPPQEFYKIAALFDQLRKDKTKKTMNYSAYLRAASDVIMRFDSIAPYEKYCGGDSSECFALLEAIRKDEKKSSDVKTGEAEKQYALQLVEQSNGVITIDDAIKFVQILAMKQGYSTDVIIDAFDDFTGVIVNQYGEISSVAKVSFFLGVLNANGIINDIEMEEMRESFVKAIMSRLAK